MLPLEALLRLSIIQAELRALASHLSPNSARVVNHAARVLDILRTSPGSDSSDHAKN